VLAVEANTKEEGDGDGKQNGDDEKRHQEFDQGESGLGRPPGKRLRQLSLVHDRR
jgi:hypothetical protein